MNEPLGWLCMDRSSPLGRSLIVQAVLAAVVTPH